MCVFVHPMQKIPLRHFFFLFKIKFSSIEQITKPKTVFFLNVYLHLINITLLFIKLAHFNFISLISFD